MHRRRDVLICVPCLLVGGTEIHTLLLARALMSGGWRVTVCAYFEHDPITLAEFEGHGVRIILLSLDRQRDRRNIACVPRLIAALVKVMREIRPFVVHVQYMAPGMAPLLAARLAEVPAVVATVHVTANHYGRRRWLPRNIATAFCDAFLCVSGTVETSFFGESAAQLSRPPYQEGRRHFTIHNCVDLARIDEILAEPLPDELRKSLKLEGRLIVGIVGRLDRYKGHDLLLRALAIVTRAIPEAALLCIGGGEERERLEEEARRLGIADCVLFTGAIPQWDVFRHLRLMDVVAMPSRIGLEGFGLAAAEAMAFGRPVIASSADALREVVGGDGVAGVLVPPGDYVELAARIERLLKDPGERARLGRAARARVEEKFSMPRFTQRHLDLYRGLCRGRAHAVHVSGLAIGALS